MPRKQHTHHFIYKTTCKVTGKFYIGMHSTSNLDDGYLGSGKYLWNSIRKHGKENHEIEIIEWFEDRSSLKERERELVNEEMLKDSMCMNLKPGGEGGFSKEIQSILGKRGNEKMKRLKKNDQEWKTQRNIIQSRSLVNSYKKGTRKVKIPDWTGKKHTQETRKKIGEKNSLCQEGKLNSNFGKMWIHNIESKKNKSIKKEEIIPDGWIKGRKMKF